MSRTTPAPASRRRLSRWATPAFGIGAVGGLSCLAAVIALRVRG